MSWLVWSNPVAIWWSFLVAVSVVNIAFWLLLYGYFRTANSAEWRASRYGRALRGLCFWLRVPFHSARADVQRICLFDMWLSSVFIGRSVATVAEVCFAAQWAITLRLFAKFTKSDSVLNISNTVVPLIVLAECFSWHAVITTDYLGNVIENSIWAVTFLLIAGALFRLIKRIPQRSAGCDSCSFRQCHCLRGFSRSHHVPMHFDRWQADQESGKKISASLPACTM